MLYLLRYLLCTIFVLKTAWRKYCFQILSKKTLRLRASKIRIWIWSEESTQSAVWILWIHDPFLDLLPQKRKIRVWIRKSGFGFSPKHRTLTALGISMHQRYYPPDIVMISSIFSNPFHS